MCYENLLDLDGALNTRQHTDIALIDISSFLHIQAPGFPAEWWWVRYSLGLAVTWSVFFSEIRKSK